MNEFEFVRHDECPQCGSKDNLSVYANKSGQEKKYCESQGCNYTEGYSSVPHENRWTPPQLVHRDIRGIPKDVLEKYSIGMTEDLSLLYQCYYDDGVMIGAKVRNPDKEMWFEGSNPNHKLFGMQNARTYTNLIITEGELDAAAAYYMTRWASVSIPNGAKAAAKSVKRNLRWIEKFKRIYICFDSDEAGVDAADEVMQIIKPGKAFRVTMQRKDACEYTKADDRAGFKQAIDEAQPISVDAFYSQDRLKEQWLAFWSGGTDGGINTGIDALDEWGIRMRPGELTTVYAMPAVGKSTLVRQIAANLVRRGLNVLLVPFEEQGIKYFAQVVGMVNDRKLLKDSPETMEDRLTLFDSVKEHLHLSTASLSDSTVKMKDYLEYACRSLDIHLIIFDNITKYTSISGNQTQDIGTTMAYLVSVAQSCNTHVICVSHTSRDKDLKDGEAPSMQAGYNSGSIERFSDTVITMGRRPESHICRIAVRKDRANNHVGEFDIEFDYQSYTFRGVTHDEEEVRQQIRGTGDGSLPGADTDTESQETSTDTLDIDPCLQPRLHSGVQGEEATGGSEGETLEGGRAQVQLDSVIGTWEPTVRFNESFPTIHPAKFYEYL